MVASIRTFAAGKTTKLEDMRKYLLIIGVIISISIQAFASKSAIYNENVVTIDGISHAIPVDLFDGDNNLMPLPHYAKGKHETETSK